jgi:hypothetical protein
MTSGSSHAAPYTRRSISDVWQDEEERWYGNHNQKVFAQIRKAVSSP